MARVASFVRGEQNPVPYTPDSAVIAGQIILIGVLVCVANRDIAAGEVGEVMTGGVWRVNKPSSGAMTAGAKLYADIADQNVQTTADSGTNKAFGYVTPNGAAADGDTTVEVLLHQLN